MKKLLIPALLFTALQAPAQTLFTIGNDSIPVQEFMYAYRKNNGGGHSAKALHDYLQLYIASKLKIKEARSRGYDTMLQFRTDLEALRAQVMPGYLNDPQGVRQLTEEAFDRSQKDLKVAHIFISARNAAGDVDTAAALQKATDAYARLRSGTPFAQVARQFSNDPSVASNGGSLGYITVFSLPYELENLAYATTPGAIAPLHRSAAGYHILKVEETRKAFGRMRAAQILLAYPPEAGAAEKATLRKRADSIYAAIKKGASFESLAEKWSNDPISAGAGGLMPEFGVGQYDPVFEKAAFGLAKDGAVTAPFETVHGVHLVKRVKRTPPFAEKSEAALQALRDKVQASDRMEATKDLLLQKVLQQAGYKAPPQVLLAALEARTRRTLAKTAGADELSGTAVLFRLGDEPYTVDDWLPYAQNFHVKEDGSGDKPFVQLWQEYVAAQAMEHYSQNLETYNDDFRNQMAEFKEGNLFFEIMQRELWTPAQADSIGLRRFYEANKARYRWSRSADAVLFYATNATDAQKLAAQVQKAPAQWRRLAAQYADAVTSDSARFEWSSLPGAAALPFKRGAVSKVQVTEGDSSATFALVLQVYQQPVQRSFEEARGVVTNDFQAEKEREWLNSLRQKYPVWINEAALKRLEQMK
jgi:peptidyl-prolyl cis-trans isomerase SurA